VLYVSTFNFDLSAGMKGSRGAAPPSSRLARRRRGFYVLSYSSNSEQSMNKQQQCDNDKCDDIDDGDECKNDKGDEEGDDNEGNERLGLDIAIFV
jgi:hypothetical protein